MPAPLIAAAGHVLKRRVIRRAVKVAAVLLPVAAAGAGAVVLVLVLIVQGGTPHQGESASSCSTVTGGAAVSVADLTPEQVANAQSIVAVGRKLDVPPYGWVVAVATAMQESGLRNLRYGDRDSLGLFQQRAGWGSAQDRTNPVAAARMFYEGGAGGQPGLLKVPGFEGLPLTQAAQAVQRSAFPGAYGRWEGLARQVVGNPTVLSATCYDAGAFTSDGSPGASAVSAALSVIGTPYSWGGGGPAGPSRGFGAGAAVAGFDCSSLAQYAWFTATGVRLPRVTDQIAASLPHVPRGAGLRPGDLLFFHAPSDPAGSYHHMGIYDGQGNMVHAPQTGKTVEVVHDVMHVPYFAGQFAFAARPPASRPGSAQAGGPHG
ncbi:C40 family peptidase [Oryzihumus leptocrescens]|uniref:Cell wall-associated NlpC family hydrolase n=1 Tax=Oryzihumus leptocrescens TaxID=297536 RepID=A0A542ZEN2_9MICO|nr:NlpC/P60 family protein [Oryzihumus leptocrescens]TQL58794.1 cell wall-associated NlpC family hydrolase [Oryzihumus leptocrescens]